MPAANSLKWINTTVYPIHTPDSALLRATIDDVRGQLKAKGCAVIKNFIRPEALAEMASEAAALAPRAYFTHAQATVYGGEPDAGFPQGHGIRCRYSSSTKPVSKSAFMHCPPKLS